MALYLHSPICLYSELRGIFTFTLRILGARFDVRDAMPEGQETMTQQVLRGGAIRTQNKKKRLRLH